MTSKGNGVWTFRRTLVRILAGEKGQGKGEDRCRNAESLLLLSQPLSTINFCPARLICVNLCFFSASSLPQFLPSTPNTSESTPASFVTAVIQTQQLYDNCLAQEQSTCHLSRLTELLWGRPGPTAARTLPCSLHLPNSFSCVLGV